MPNFPTIEAFIGNTPLVRLQRMVPSERGNLILAKLEGNNPAGSVKDRAATSMIQQAEQRGEISVGDVLIEATSGNTGIALAMAAAIKGYKMRLIMPENASEERVATMKAFGAEVIPVTQEAGMEGARDLALEMEANGEGKVLNQFSNQDNPLAHYGGTGEEIWRDTDGLVTHFVSAMGTTGTIMGTSRVLKEKNSEIVICGVQPDEDASIPGIRRWPPEYLPSIFDPKRVDRVFDMTQSIAEETTRQLAAQEGIFCGVSSGGAVAAALELEKEVNNAVIVTVICDRGDRYLSTGVFPA
jgi:cysteine synthase B